ncbi:MAG TPA: tRNA (adenosine(37)-N6)-threonylcarbamoyltransferase complex dimerization subunit type 1 TsaB [Caldisericia bacterium]|nr:tRNA (adenosine(37)-N6)-threonylcarbamoyltransferase complex dimerization subunit type 1 TsaB [Caldisericia bacterium]HPF48375.1 tRNA (adenosine(37)-N6)-threonylcarbamoyltransferase complex dimerization subunit type 1 TsaB [Caldisericia bacterium]HPI83446.1 tRNA (adenosine(37)-N6)-threonylcarbamoyltransferase complex dimerization subunit type 1 TsaB [Caldisericia bacterium]HPQ92829.1 tRNA (adenosine(37)-N6)-threonylcarbamoyltransferase complex dimerization subunit type 1 TsaB [Caldisericia ba
MGKVSSGLTLGVLSVCSPQFVFLIENGSILISKELSFSMSQGNRIVQSVKSCLDEVNCGIESVDNFLVLTGPGSLTGIRAGLSPIRAWAYALGKPIIPMPTLPVLAHGHASPSVAFMSAGKNKWWVQEFNGHNEDKARIVEKDELDVLDKKGTTWLSPVELQPNRAVFEKTHPTPEQALSMMDFYEAKNWMKVLPIYMFEIQYDG